MIAALSTKIDNLNGPGSESYMQSCLDGVTHRGLVLACCWVQSPRSEHLALLICASHLRALIRDVYSRSSGVDYPSRSSPIGVVSTKTEK
jgi:hypothetical protein